MYALHSEQNQRSFRVLANFTAKNVFTMLARGSGGAHWRVCLIVPEKYIICKVGIGMLLVPNKTHYNTLKQAKSAASRIAKKSNSACGWLCCSFSNSYYASIQQGVKTH